MKRLISQRNEAKYLGLEKIASALSEQISTASVREDSDAYVYDYHDLKSDVESVLWDSAIRAQDFFGKLADAKEINALIEKAADDFIHSIGVTTGSAVGLYEEVLPGQSVGDIEVGEDE